MSLQSSTVNSRRSSRSKQDIQKSLRNVTQLAQKVQQLQKSQSQPEIKYSFEYFGILGISRSQIMQLFNKISFIIIMGSKKRAESFANQAHTGLKLPNFQQIGDISRQIFCMYKIGPLLCCNHGMGIASVSLFLNELLRIMYLAKNSNYQLLRLGSSGGIGVKGGTIVITTAICDPVSFQPEWIFNSCGQEFRQECIIDTDIADKLMRIATAKGIAVECGKTVTTETYYEAQARMDGSLCEFNEEQKQNYIRKLYENGARNFEMEASVVCGMCTKHKIKCGVICVAYLDRLKSDTVSKKFSQDEIDGWMKVCIEVVLQYIYHYILHKNN